MIGLIMGPAGSGKGTQSEYICEQMGLEHMSSGDLFRKEKRKDTERAKMIRELIDKGNLVPDDVTMDMVSEFIDKYQDVLMDGTPRNLYQAKYIYEKYGVDFLVLLEVGEKEVIRRLGKRMVCTANGQIYIEGKVTQQDIDKCWKAGGKIVRREDDSDVDAIRKRLKIYHDMTEPIIHFLENKGVSILRINGEQSIEDVWKDISEALKS